MATYLDPNASPDGNTPAALRARIAQGLRTMPAIDHNGSPAEPAAAPEPVAVPDAIGMTDPATALAVLKAADALGVDQATVNKMLDSTAFVATVTGASADEITAAITARTSPAPRMAPNPGQGRAGSGPVTQPVRTLRDSFRDKARNLAAL